MRTPNTDHDYPFETSELNELLELQLLDRKITIALRQK
jgi:hypothetical protein